MRNAHIIKQQLVFKFNFKAWIIKSFDGFVLNITNPITINLQKNYFKIVNSIRSYSNIETKENYIENYLYLKQLNEQKHHRRRAKHLEKSAKSAVEYTKLRNTQFRKLGTVPAIDITSINMYNENCICIVFNLLLLLKYFFHSYRNFYDKSKLRKWCMSYWWIPSYLFLNCYL